MLKTAGCGARRAICRALKRGCSRHWSLIRTSPAPWSNSPWSTKPCSAPIEPPHSTNACWSATRTRPRLSNGLMGCGRKEHASHNPIRAGNMRRIYHLVAPFVWDAVGFIHCSNEDQVVRVANHFYADQPELLVLCIDPARLVDPVRDEEADTGERFPHIYGPIPRQAIVDVRRLTRDADGLWIFPH